ncbi:ATP-binding protein [Bacillus massilinigeriensis]|uniref:ATP-binding protein n=1 Tax=Bacillus massilionigeriensis TaxID=1805475 RepID=UPI00096B38A0|nr:AAA family ATPase [Bacillus massilionigeriensis]
MFITEIHIYGYGRLENFIIKDLNDFQVFYGENEAGKSTIMMFIHSILFGFPTRQQTELRFEPKKGSSYGGKLVFTLPQRGNVVVERVKGKATGDVSVRLEDGTIGGEELLKEILSNMDKGMYQSIFSFNLQGLQNVHLLKNEDLGKFLFSAGTFGSERLMDVEGMLQKELDLTFKPNGKKPLLNERLIELKQAQLNLQRAGEQNNQYIKLIREIEEIQSKIYQSQSIHKSLVIEIQELNKWKNLIPLIREEQALLDELLPYEGLNFPVDGMKRLDQLDQFIKPYEGQLKSIEERIHSILDFLEEVKPDEVLLQKEAEIHDSIEKLPLLEQIKQEEQKLRDRLTFIEREVSLIKEKLHTEMDEEALLLCNTGISMKDKIETNQKDYVRLLDKKVELDERFVEERRLLEEIEKRTSTIEAQLIPLEKKKELKEQVKAISNQEGLQLEQKSIQEKFDFLHRERNKQRKQKKKSQMVLLFIAIFLMALAAWGIYSNQFLLSIGSLVIMVFLFILMTTIRNDHTIEQELEKLKEKERALSRKIDAVNWRDITLIEEALKKDDELRNQYHLWVVKKEQQEIQYEKIIKAYDEWERDSKQIERNLIELGTELGLPNEIALTHLSEAFILLEKWKQHVRERKEIQYQLKLIIEKVQMIQDQIITLGKTFIPDNETGNLQEVAYQLRNRLKSENEKSISFKEKKAKLKEWQDELSKLTVELNHLKVEKEKLLKLARVEKEEEFRVVGKREEKRIILHSRIDELERQLSLAGISGEERRRMLEIESVDRTLLDKEEELKRIEQELQSLQSQAAEVKHQIQLIEDGGTYSDLLHRFKQLRFQFSEEARKWARISLAKDLLSKTVEKYKNDRLPSMLAKAEEYLSYLTDQEYIRIHPKDIGSGLLIERKDHMIFEANELSQATAEQVYVSLRLALATTLYHKYHFPIIIDDSFVNFDHIRTGKMIHLLKNIKGHQILFFTCHQHMISCFHPKEVIQLHKSSIQSV